MRLRATAGQHPDQVARAVVRQARRWAHRPETQMIARSELGPYAPRSPGPDLRGGWVPDALWRWARTLTYYREPAGPGHGGELVASLPLVVLQRAGDCDDVASAQCAMAKALGLPTAVGRMFTGQGTAHIVCGVGEDWAGGGRRLIVDPQMSSPVPAEALAGIRWFDV